MLHGQLRSAVTCTASSSRYVFMSLTEVEKREREQMREKFEELEASNATIKSENEKLRSHARPIHLHAFYLTPPPL